ncbi:hypothetical protein [Agrococcus beijingensis]|uniref:hypothetical protein n=1 Tax=Agrococcus beijingensis TaxID=3068634 RepID=UPI002740FB04|nr:hypothetical protein [Agrococcus sp. REN33]
MRAIPALVVGLALPFLALHSALVGLVALAILLAGTAVALWVGRALVPGEAGRWPLLTAAWSAVAAVVALALALAAPTATALALTVAAWGIASGVLELRGWWRMRAVTEPRTLQLARDWRAVGLFTIVLGAVLLFVRDAVTLTGLINAYAVIVGVYHALAALSARPARTNPEPERSEA